MLLNLRRALVYSLAAIAFTFAYALVGTGLAQVAFKSQADGSITANGSTLIGQNWSECAGTGLEKDCPQWFHGRPDDTGPYAGDGDNPLVACSDVTKKPTCVNGESAATNLGPRSAVLLADTKALVAYWHELGVDPTPDLVTTSGSGYDPDITPEDATVQIPMVSKATGISPGRLSALIAKESHSPELGFLGSSYVDVLQLNVALAKLRR
jgi:potassium-transporting ATPase KdpC subunit